MTAKRTTPVFLLAAMLCAALGSPAAAAAPEAPAGLTASFTAELSLGEEGPVLPLAGELDYSAGRLRVSITQDLTLEEYIALVDYDAGTLVLLYPDTLNGKRYNLADFDHLDGFARIREALDGRAPDVPGDWELTDHGPVEIDGTKCRRFSAARDEIHVEWWTGPHELPVRAHLTKDGLEVTIHVSAHDTDAAIDPALFDIPDGFTVSQAAEDLPDTLPSL